MKEGKSEVVCEAGQLIKISKDKQGVVTRDVLTKKWTDWVDYWAVPPTPMTSPAATPSP